MKPKLTEICVVAVCTALSLSGHRATAAEPANLKTSARARAILDYFHELSVRKEGRRILSGQFSNFGNGANLRIMERIHEQTGHWPALIGVDYADFGRGGLTTKVPNQAALDYWKQGGARDGHGAHVQPGQSEGWRLARQGSGHLRTAQARHGYARALDEAAR